MDQVKVEMTGTAMTTRYGTLKTGDILRTDTEFANHLVNDCGVAKYATAKVNKAVSIAPLTPAAPKPPKAPKSKEKPATVKNDPAPPGTGSGPDEANQGGAGGAAAAPPPGESPSPGSAPAGADVCTDRSTAAAAATT